MDQQEKPIIEMLINTSAIALTAFGVNEIIAHRYYGFLVIIFAAGLEFVKYWGRKYFYW